jgi:hypothetical protein
MIRYLPGMSASLPTPLRTRLATRRSATDDTSVTEISDVRYARSGDVSIAYQVDGDGPVDVVFVRGNRPPPRRGMEGSRTTTLFAASYPERTTTLVALNPSIKGRPTADYAWAP